MYLCDLFAITAFKPISWYSTKNYITGQPHNSSPLLQFPYPTTYSTGQLFICHSQNSLRSKDYPMATLIRAYPLSGPYLKRTRFVLVNPVYSQLHEGLGKVGFRAKNIATTPRWCRRDRNFVSLIIGVAFVSSMT